MSLSRSQVFRFTRDGSLYLSISITLHKIADTVSFLKFLLLERF